jgi:Bifunctional DNA primase/polymerase, N-terminal
MAHLTDLYPWGRFYHRRGTNVLALAPHTKKPIDPYKGWQDRRQTPADLAAQPWRWAGGLGLLSGINDWRVFDFDHCPDFDAVAALLAALDLPTDYAWVVRSGSRQGWHVWVRCPRPLPAGALPAKKQTAGVFVAPGRGFDHLELRWKHCYTVAPPSLHPSGRRYRFVHGRPTAAPAWVSPERVVAAFHAVTHTPARTTAHGLTVRLHGLPRRADDPFRALKAEFDMLGFARQHWPGRMVDEGNDVRVLGHGGLLLNPERGIWHCFREQMGGDVIDLVGYARYGTAWDRRQPRMFRAAVREAAAFAGVPGAGPAPAERRPVPTAGGGRPGPEPVATDPVAPQGRPAAPTIPANSGGRHIFVVIGGHPAPEPRAPGAASVAPPAASPRRWARSPSEDGPRPRPRRARRPEAPSLAPAHADDDEDQRSR